MALSIDQQIDRMIRDLKILASILNCPGATNVPVETNIFNSRDREKIHVPQRIHHEYKFEENAPMKGRKLYEILILRDGDDPTEDPNEVFLKELKTFEKTGKDIQLLAMIDCMKEGIAWYQTDPINGDWGFDDYGNITKGRKEIPDFSEFLWKRFNITNGIQNTKHITQIIPVRNSQPFKRLLKQKPVYYRTIWKCHDILKNNRDEIKTLVQEEIKDDQSKLERITEDFAVTTNNPIPGPEIAHIEITAPDTAEQSKEEETEENCIIIETGDYYQINYDPLSPYLIKKETSSTYLYCLITHPNSKTGISAEDIDKKYCKTKMKQPIYSDESSFRSSLGKILTRKEEIKKNMERIEEKMDVDPDNPSYIEKLTSLKQEEEKIIKWLNKNSHKGKEKFPCETDKNYNRIKQGINRTISKISNTELKQYLRDNVEIRTPTFRYFGSIQPIK